MVGSPTKRFKREMLDEHEAEIIDLMGRGITLAKIGEQFGCGVNSVLRWIEGNDERRQSCARARTRAAEVLAERCLTRTDELIDRAQVGLADKIEVAATKLANETYQWLASKWDPSKYGDARASITVNVNTLVLDALRQPSLALAGSTGQQDASGPVIELEAEAVEVLTLNDVL